jgi:tetratricopeptide (TPR) repeat protein
MRALPLLLLLAAPAWWTETNSHVAAGRGRAAFEQKNFAEAAAAYAQAMQRHGSPTNAFNSGTARVAAGQREEGSAELTAALRDPALRADALFNRGNSAFAASAWEHAIRDYAEALRTDPRHAAAKRNLEIALQQKASSEKDASRGAQGKNEGKSKEPQAPAPGQPRPQPGQLDAEALLRSVQQHEQEELRRLKGQPAQGKVGW